MAILISASSGLQQSFFCQKCFRTVRDVSERGKLKIGGKYELRKKARELA